MTNQLPLDLPPVTLPEIPCGTDNQISSHLLLFISALLGTGLLLGFFLWNSYRQTELVAEVALKNVTTTVEARFDATLRRIEANLEHIAAMLPDAALDEKSVARYSEQVRHDLELRAQHFPELSSFRIIDADGNGLYNSGAVVPPYNVSDRAYFHSAKNIPGKPLHFSGAIVGKRTDQPVIVMAKALTDRAGRFRGVVIGALKMGYFTELFSTLNLGPSGVVALRRTDDGALLARWPALPDALNIPFKPDHPMRPWLTSGNPEGVQRIHSQADGSERLYVFRRLERYPFFVIPGRSPQEYLAEWRKMAAVSIILTGIALLVFAFLLRKQWRARQLEIRQRHRLAEARDAAETANRALQVDEMRLNAMLTLSEAAAEMSEHDLLRHGLEEAQRLTGSEIAYLHFINADQETIQLYTWSENTLRYCTAAFDGHYPVTQAGMWADAVRLKAAVTHNDFQQMTGRRGYPEGHVHLTRHMASPVLEGELVRMIIGVGNKPGNYDNADLRQLQLIADNIWKIVSLRRTMLELEQARDAAEAASRAKSTFLANMSHELRTPMNGIMGMASVALRHANDPKLRHQLETINNASQHLLGVINDILDISKIEAGRLSLEQVDFRLGDLLENLRDLIGNKVAEKHLTLQFDVPAALQSLPLSGDPLRLGQILLNLSGNAVKFTEQGSVTIYARLSDETTDQVRLCCGIRDTGIGIEVEDQKRLFASFEQADSSMTRKYGGTGLGLVISKRLVEMMGGEIDVESTPGQGSTFRFSVQLARGRIQPADTASTTSAEAMLASRYAGTRILIAEDEPINQEVSRGLLEDIGLQVDVADDGAEALALARQHRYALILMDIQMPKMNGVDATRAIRLDSLNTDTPILAMTANAFEEDRQICLAAGMNDHIGKPVDPDKLFEVMLSLLKSR